MALKNIRHIGIVTNNIKKSLFFYQKIFKLKIFKSITEDHFSLAKVMGFDRVKIKTIKLKSKKNNTMVELLYWKIPKSNKKQNFKNLNDLGLTHFAITVNNLDKTYQLLKENNIKVLSKPHFGARKKVKYVFCKSPENVFIEIVEEIKQGE